MYCLMLIFQILYFNNAQAWIKVLISVPKSIRIVIQALRVLLVYRIFPNLWAEVQG